MPPAGQRLHAGDPAVREIHDRLVDHVQRGVGQGPVQLLAQRHLGVEGGPHRRLEDGVRVLAALLGRVHRQVHVLAQVLGGDPARRRGRIGRPDAGGDRDGVRADHERLPQVVEHPLRLRGRIAGLADQHHELVAAEPGDDVRRPEGVP
jgi:hypothetical protein